MIRARQLAAALSVLFVWAPLAAPWRHEHAGAPPYHDHGTGAVHAHWDVEPDEPEFAVVRPIEEHRYCAGLAAGSVSSHPRLDLAFAEPAVAPPSRTQRSVARGTAPRSHGPPASRFASPRSPPAQE